MTIATGEQVLAADVLALISDTAYGAGWDGDTTHAPSKNAVYDKIQALNSVPSGIIVMWHGTIANIPSGYVICDGNNSTPNLLAKFVEGVATAATNPGTTGGATNKTTAGHTHTGPSHQHDMPVTNYSVPTTPQPESGAKGIVDTGGGRSHVPGPTDAAGTGATGSNTDTIADIRPAYYDIAFLMKT